MVMIQMLLNVLDAVFPLTAWGYVRKRRGERGMYF